MNKIKDMTGQKFDKLTVIELVGSDKSGKAMWRCECECKNIVVVLGLSLRNGHTKSCGCLKKESLLSANTKHGENKTRIHGIWVNMRARCNNENHPEYKHYGGRGIKICGEWNDFVAFRDWSFANRYDDNLTIDRINNNGNYEPSNCRWSTMKVQNTNKRWNRNITYNGKTQCMTEWENELNIPLSTRIHKYGMDIDKALTLPKKKYTKILITYNGKTQTVAQWAKEKGMLYPMLCWRLKRWSLEKALITPIRAMKSFKRKRSA